MHQPFLNVWIIVPDHLQIAPEHRVVRRVKSGDGHISAKIVSMPVPAIPSTSDKNPQSDISFGQMLPKNERPLRLAEHLLHPIQRLKQALHILLIRRLPRGKTRLVHPIIDFAFDPELYPSSQSQFSI
jgi:hypothetical protein